MFPVVFLIYANIFVIIKILIRKPKFRLSEIIYLVISGTLFASIVLALLYFQVIPERLSSILGDIFVYLFIIQFLKKIHGYSFKKAFIITSTASILVSFFDQSISFVLTLFIEMPSPAAYLLLLPIKIFSSAITAVILVEFTKSIRDTLRSSKHLQTVLLLISILLILAFQASSLYEVYPERISSSLLLINILFFAAFISIGFVSFITYAGSVETRLTAQSELQAKKLEQEVFDLYIDNLENNQADIRKFKHDYKNILMSIGSFLKDKDLDGLTDYYTNKIQAASQLITDDDFALDEIAKLKVRELKSILAAKLMVAKNSNIAITFEALEDIDNLPIDSLSLVRMLGIILDNAIEACEEIDGSKLRVGFLSNLTDITIVVENTCKPNIPTLQELKKPGFSTKGENRGLGLSNLIGMVNLYPNVTLETSVTECTFIQKLTLFYQH